MKTKIGKQEAAYKAVKAYREKHPDATLKQCITAVAKETKSTFYAVNGAYYTHAKRNGEVFSGNVVRNLATAATPKQGEIDLNSLHVTLSQALKAVENLKNERKKNEQIISRLRKALVI